MAQSQAANLFGGKRFWSFAILASITFATMSYCSEQNEKADAEKQHARAVSLATEAGAVDKCKGWMKQLYGSNDPSFRVLKTSITSRSELMYRMDHLLEQTSFATKTTFQSVEHCTVIWNSKKDIWETSVKH